MKRSNRSAAVIAAATLVIGFAAMPVMLTQAADAGHDEAGFHQKVLDRLYRMEQRQLGMEKKINEIHAMLGRLEKVH